jgi:hypothetical protein
MTGTLLRLAVEAAREGRSYEDALKRAAALMAARGVPREEVSRAACEVDRVIRVRVRRAGVRVPPRAWTPEQAAQVLTLALARGWL